MDNNTRIANTDQEKDEVLAKFFTSVFTKETDDDKTLLDNEVDSDSSDNEFKPEEILKLLKELNTSKSPDRIKCIPKFYMNYLMYISHPFMFDFQQFIKNRDCA